jgi:hypothetical protein
MPYRSPGCYRPPPNPCLLKPVAPSSCDKRLDVANARNESAGEPVE